MVCWKERLCLATNAVASALLIKCPPWTQRLLSSAPWAFGIRAQRIIWVTSAWGGSECACLVCVLESERDSEHEWAMMHIYIYIYMLGPAKLVKAAREWTRDPEHGRGEREHIFCSPYYQVVRKINTIHSSLPPKKTKPTLFPSPLPVSSLLSHKRLANSARTWRHVLALGFGCTSRYLKRNTKYAWTCCWKK